MNSGRMKSHLVIVFKIYKNLLPDLLIIIPTKFDIYCNFIDELKCKKMTIKRLFLMKYLKMCR